MYVYVLKGENRIKVGYSSTPMNRLESIQVHTVDDLELAYVSPKLEKFKLIERLAHRLLMPFKTKGEWFNVTVDDGIKAIEKAITIVENEQEGWFLKNNKYKYNERLNLTLLGDDVTKLETIKHKWEKELNQKLSSAEVIRRLIKLALFEEKVRLHSKSIS